VTVNFGIDLWSTAVNKWSHLFSFNFTISILRKCNEYLNLLSLFYHRNEIRDIRRQIRKSDHTKHENKSDKFQVKKSIVGLQKKNDLVFLC